MRNTFAQQEYFTFRLKATASLLQVSENTLRTYLKDSGLEIKRANADNPNSPAVRLFEIADVFKLSQFRREQGLIKRLPDTPTVISVHIAKGGTGKSTTACELGIQLQLEGHRVLLIDLDVQSNLTQLLGYESDFSIDEAEPNGLTPDAIVDGTFSDIVSRYLESTSPRATPIIDVSSMIKYPFGASGPALIPADTFLGELEQTLALARGNRELVFRRLLEDSAAGKVPGLDVNQFDFIVIDCPPSISFASTNAIAASHIVLAPIKMDSFGVKGMARLITEINGLSKRSPEVRPDLVILPTHYSTNINRVARMQQQLQSYRHNLSPTVISTSELFPKSQENYLPLTLQQPTSAPVSEYRELTKYILSKCLKKETKASANPAFTA